jgi:gliding motility-associated-like protein
MPIRWVLYCLIFSAVLLLRAEVSGQAPARLRCVEVLDNGDVVVYWRAEPVGTGAYLYELYHSASPSGPFSLLVSIDDLSQSSFTHSGAGGNTAPQYYFLYIYRSSGQSPPSDTLASMLLQASTADLEVVSLSWTPLHQPLPSYTHPWYLLYREYPPGNWMVVDSTQSLDLNYHFWECNYADDTVRFKIAVKVEEAPYSCESLSNERYFVLKNSTNRFPPVIDSVSIDAGGRSVIGWEPATEPDVVGYKIFRVNGSNDSIGYVDGRLNTFYTDLDSDPCNGPISYILLSIDSCGNESPFPYDPVTFTDKPHNTLYLQDIQYDPCQMSNSLVWNEYKNFDPPLSGYQVYVSENSGPFQLLISLPRSATSFVHNDLNSNTRYDYFVRAYVLGEQKTSTSCIRGNVTYDSPRPDFMYIRYVTVEDNIRVNILIYADSSAHVDHYQILRSETITGPFEQVGYFQDPGLDSISFLDATAEVNTMSFYYQVRVTDSCGIVSNIANTARTIFLEVDALEDYRNVLSWNAYETWDGTVDGYNIYRRLNDAPSMDLLAQTGPGELSYSDNVAGLSGVAGKISYMIEAREGEGNLYGFREFSLSNEVLAGQRTRVYVPNAICPNGINNELKPVTVFVDATGYRFLVYNRWGELIFETDELGQGWDGTYQGKPVQGGIYVYLLKYRNALGEDQVQKGNVAVIY